MLSRGYFLKGIRSEFLKYTLIENMSKNVKKCSSIELERIKVFLDAIDENSLGIINRISQEIENMVYDDNEKALFDAIEEDLEEIRRALKEILTIIMMKEVKTNESE